MFSSLFLGNHQKPPNAECETQFTVSDVLIKIQERKLRTIDYIVPEDNIEELPVHIYNCINSFVKPWKICEFSHRKYSSSCMHFTERVDKEAVLYQQEYEIDDKHPSVLLRPFD